MLKYKITLNEPKGYDEIEYESIYFSPNSDFISGVTVNNDNGLINGQKIYLEFDDNEFFIPAKVSITHSIRQGYVEYKEQEYEIIKESNHYGVRYCDGLIYLCSEDGDNLSLKIPMVNGPIVVPKTSKTVKIPTVYYVEDGKVKIGEISYDVEIDFKIKTESCKEINALCENGLEVASNNVVVPLGDSDMSVNAIIYPIEEWKNKTKFVIRKETDFLLDRPYVKCAKKIPYFTYSTNTSDRYLDTVKNLYSIRNYFKTEDISEKIKTEKIDENIIKTYSITRDGKIFLLSEDKLFAEEADSNYNKKSDGLKYNIEYELVESNFGDYLVIIPNEKYVYNPGQRILAYSDARYTRYYVKGENDNKYVEYNGSKYFKSDETDYFVTINGITYEIFKTAYKWGMVKYTPSPDILYGYILENDLPILVIVRDGYCYIKNGLDNTYNTETKFSTTTADKSIKYEVEEKGYVVIDGIKHYVDKEIMTNEQVMYPNNEETTYSSPSVEDNSGKVEKYYITINGNKKYELHVSEVINSTTLLCEATTLSTDDIDVSSIYRELFMSQKNVTFYLENILFDDKITSLDNEVSISDGLVDKTTLKLFNYTSYIDIPLKVDTEICTNIMQQDTLEKFFYKKEINERINPVVDIEREIYYPAFNKIDSRETHEIPQLSLIDNIQFNLHFRTRDKDWKIIDEKSWNIFDYYNYSDEDEDSNKNPKISWDNNELKERLRYNQPADLLGFLNFTTDDVFYQKNKIGKSFLRLLFFNSPDPMNQDLLYSCTVFVNEGALYKKYTDCVQLRDDRYILVNNKNTPNSLNVDKVITGDSISVNYDTSTEKPFKVNFAEDRRLSMSFDIKNRYESSESAEGFYLYIFKEYCERLHEEPIYMKVEFNHAGEGRTINFIMPFEQEVDDAGEPLYDSNGNPKYKLIDLSLGEGDTKTANIDKFKQGIPLREIMQYMYIPLESVYDFKNKRYCYYMPYWMTHVKKNDANHEIINNNDRTMTFNLYELKIKDES